MTAADTVIRLIGGTIALALIIFIMGVGYTLVEPIYNNVIDPELMTSLGWGTPQDTILLFMGLAFIGLIVVVVVWWLASPVREDVRQSIRRPPL